MNNDRRWDTERQEWVYPAEWWTVSSAPEMKVILLWGVTDRGPNGEIRNWKMATGCRHVGYKGDKWWEWDGRTLADYDHQPTHWMYLPEPPND